MRRIIITIVGILVLIMSRNLSVRSASLEEPDILSGAAIVIEADSGTVLYEKNADTPYPPASIVKLLTALIIAETTQPDETVIFSYDAVYRVENGSGNPISIEAGDKLTVQECMYAMLLQSSNQAANALAEHVAGSNEKFAEYMNKKAANLGCTASYFVNPSGLNDRRQVVTARDMANIAVAAFNNSLVREIASSKEYQLPPTLNNKSGLLLQMEHRLLNSNAYIYDYAFAGKTGYTVSAGNTLVTAAQKNEKKLIAVILKSEQTHYEDTIKLFDYGFSYLEVNPIIAKERTEESDTNIIRNEIKNIDKNEMLYNRDTRMYRWYIIVCIPVFGFLYVKLKLRMKRRKRKIRRKKNRTDQRKHANHK